MDHIISIEEKETGETSRGHDQPVIVAGDTDTLSKEEKFKTLKEARVKWKNLRTTKPKVPGVVFMHFNKSKIVLLY